VHPPHDNVGGNGFGKYGCTLKTMELIAIPFFELFGLAKHFDAGKIES